MIRNIGLWRDTVTLIEEKATTMHKVMFNNHLSYFKFQNMHKAGCSLVQYIVFNKLRDIVRNILANVNDFTQHYTFTITLVVKCSNITNIFQEKLSLL